MLQGVTGGFRGLQGYSRVDKGLQFFQNWKQQSYRGYAIRLLLLRLLGVTRGYWRLQGVTKSYKGLEGVTRGYSRLHGVTRGYRGLQGVTVGYMRLQEVAGCYKGLRVLQ